MWLILCMDSLSILYRIYKPLNFECYLYYYVTLCHALHCNKREREIRLDYLAGVYKRAKAIQFCFVSEQKSLGRTLSSDILYEAYQDYGFAFIMQT